MKLHQFASVLFLDFLTQTVDQSYQSADLEEQQHENLTLD